MSNIFTSNSQTKNIDSTTYNWFDNTTGRENLNIINGIPNINPYKTVGDNSIYLWKDQYENGSLTYENLPYFNLKLKYDIYRDILILSPSEKSENIGINVNPEKTQSFSIKDKTFVRVQKTIDNPTNFTTGYYEETILNSDLTFYIKHHKNGQNSINDDGIVYRFKTENLYFLNLKNNIIQIKSKSDLIKLFPELKRQINDFYLMNRELKQTDLDQFFKNLIKYVTKTSSN